MAKVSIAKGMRDFNAGEVFKRQYITSVIRDVFEGYGYAPLETPSMENLSTLTGKYGDEGDKLIFRVLKSGDFLKSVPPNATRDAAKWSAMVSDKALRYDLTVPFARYISTNLNDIKLPFKRYQIQSVWRADRPQKGRFREFMQCDADVVGSDSLWQEVELMLIYADVFKALNLPVRIRISNRNILAGMAEYAGIAHAFMPFCTILDKVDKIGVDKVIEQWVELGITPERASALADMIQLSGEDGLNKLKSLHQKATEDVRFVIKHFKENNDNPQATLLFDPSLARGLDYYTGCVFEVEALDVSVGSVGGGGRYADLTGIFGVKNVPGVGISFGLDRIYIALEEKHLFPNDVAPTPYVLGVNFGDDTSPLTFKNIMALRRAGVMAEFYPEKAKLKKQFDYANARNIRFVMVIGDTEAEKGIASIKDMTTGTQEEVSLTEIVAYLSRKLEA